MIPVSMISCHLLLGEPWYKEYRATYDHLTYMYHIIGGKKCDLVCMPQQFFIAWRKDHLERLKEKEEAMEKEVEATALLTSKIKIDVIAQNEDPKPRTVSFQGGEDDTTSFSYSRTNDNDDVQATHQDQVIIAPLVTVNDVYVPNYTSVDKKYTEKIARLVEVTCMHTMVLAETHSLKKEENKMLDVHALRGERYMCVHGKKDYTSMFDQGVHQSGYFFWLLHPKHVQVIHVQEICFLEINHGIISCYYFSRLRPPELEVQVSRFKW